MLDANTHSRHRKELLDRAKELGDLGLGGYDIMRTIQMLDARRKFKTVSDWEWWQRSSECQQVIQLSQKILAEHRGVKTREDVERTNFILPKSLIVQLNEESEKRGMSRNNLAVHKLSIPAQA